MDQVTPSTKYLDQLSDKPGQLNNVYYLARIRQACQSEAVYQKVIVDLLTADLEITAVSSRDWRFSYTLDDKKMVAGKFVSIGVTGKMATPAIVANHMELRYTLVESNVPWAGKDNTFTVWIALGKKLSEGTIPVTDLNQEEVRDG